VIAISDEIFWMVLVV